MFAKRRLTRTSTLAFLGLTASAIALAGPGSEMPVTLFGQSCVLRGPVQQSVLKSIHAVSPEQLFPDYEKRPFGALGGQIRKSADSLKKTAALPSGLDRYKERLSKRWQSQLAFLDAIEGFKTGAKADGFLTSLGNHLLPGKNRKSFESMARKLDGKTAELAKTQTTDQLFEAYNEAIEPDPEEEFHRAIQRMQVQYDCAMEESGEDTDDEG